MANTASRTTVKKTTAHPAARVETLEDTPAIIQFEPHPDYYLHLERTESLGPGGFAWLQLRECFDLSENVIPLVELTREGAESGLVVHHVYGWDTGKPLVAGVSNPRMGAVHLTPTLPLLRVRLMQRALKTVES